MKRTALTIAGLGVGALVFAGAAAAMPLAPATHAPAGLDRFDAAVEPVHYVRKRYYRRHAYYPRYRYRYHRPYYYSYGYAPYYGGYPYYGYPYYGWGPGISFGFSFR